MVEKFEKSILEKKYSNEDMQEKLLNLYAGEDKDKRLLLKKYWDYIEDTSESIQKDLEIGYKRHKEDIVSEKEEIKQFITQLLDNKIFPVISLPKKFLDIIKKEGGIHARDTYIPGVKLIAGILGMKPYEKQGEDRVLLEIQCKPEDLDPRFTGKNKSYNGVVVFNKDFIPLEKINIKKPAPM